MCFIVPPLPGEPLHTVQAVAARIGCSRETVYSCIKDGKLAAFTSAGRTVISESEVQKFVLEWPTLSRNKGVSARWREFREWQQAQRAAAHGEAA
jgi:excisionase family DNA binding protein